MSQKDEDLLLFKDLQKREKHRSADLLQLVSDEFDPTSTSCRTAGTHSLYRIVGKKGFENDKNDYDWLKTPPATPLFPSLEMEAKGPQSQFVVQRQLPITSQQPSCLSRQQRFVEAAKAKDDNGAIRSKTPSHRPGITSSTVSEPRKSLLVHQKTSHDQYHATNLISKNITASDSKKKPKSRGVPPLVRSTANPPPQTTLLINRSNSATRGRPARSSLNLQNPAAEPVVPKPRRQSCSPSSITRGPRQETISNSRRGLIKTQTPQFLGSSMVDKLINARKLAASTSNEREQLIGPKARYSAGDFRSKHIS